jgi:hypothetical protein
MHNHALRMQGGHGKHHTHYRIAASNSNYILLVIETRQVRDLWYGLGIVVSLLSSRIIISPPDADELRRHGGSGHSGLHHHER